MNGNVFDRLRIRNMRFICFPIIKQRLETYS